MLFVVKGGVILEEFSLMVGRSCIFEMSDLLEDVFRVLNQVDSDCRPVL